MCSIVEEDFGDEGGAHVMVEEPVEESPKAAVCKKCNEKKAVARLMCEECFVINIRHKFRASLGSTKIVRRHSNVLLHFTGNVESVCLTEMIRFGFEEATHKRLCFELEMVYIDENCLVKEVQDAYQRLEKLHQVQMILKQFPNFKCHYSSIAVPSFGEMKLITDLNIDDITSVTQQEVKFMNKFKAIQSLSSKQDLLDVTRTDILRHAATSLNCTYIFLCDTSIELANRLITKIALGRGSAVAHDVAFCDDRIESLKIVRPLKELISNDALTFAQFKSIQYLEPTSFGDDHGHLASIQNLSSKFIYDLQQNFPSTVSTVYRTCSKIAPAASASSVTDEFDLAPHFAGLKLPETNNRCLMCKSFLDAENAETLFAIDFSRHVSNNKDAHLENLNMTGSEKAKNNIRNHLCHGCCNVFIGVTDEDLKEFF